jgi:uncharacterized damage-inducible protein DinB
MTATTPASAAAVAAMPSPKQLFLDSYEREHAITMRVLRAYPPERADLRPHPKCKTARELAWVFTLERALGTMVFNDAFATGAPPSGPPPPPDSWQDVLAAFEKAHRDFAEVIRATPDDVLLRTVRFFTGPGTLSDVRRIDLLWFLLSDEIHHRGQFSIYLRMADGKVPSIYGPSADEPWM